jgi:Flp pilus assembly pilin Flp
MAPLGYSRCPNSEAICPCSLSTGAKHTTPLAVAIGLLGRGKHVKSTIMLLQTVWADDSAQDVAEYAVMLAVILVVVIGTVKLIGGKSNNIFSEVASSIQ